jgi:hypothetical protein
MRTFDHSYVKVGLPENGNPSAGESSMSDLVTIGAVQEFGAPKRGIPERPFMRQSFDKNVLKIKKVQDELYSRVLKNTITVKKGLDTLGEVFTRLVKEEITSGNFKPNAPSTIARKNRSKPSATTSRPLIDTGQMRASIQPITVMGGFDA